MAPARRPWPIIFLLLPLLLALVWIRANGYEGVNGQDAHDYWHIAREWKWHWAGGERPVMAEHPHGYPIAGAAVGLVVGNELIGLRVVSALSLLLLAFSLRWVLARYPENEGQLLAFVLLAVPAGPFLLRYAMMCMSDVPGIALVFLAYVMLVRWQQQEGPRFLLWAMVFAAAAMTVRLAVAPLIGALVLAMVHGDKPGRRVRWTVACIAAGALIALVVFFADGAEGGVQHTPLAEWSPLNLFRRELHSDDGLLTYRFPNIVYVLGVFVHPGVLPIGVFLLPFVRAADLFTIRARMAAWCVGCYLLFIAGMPFQNDRVLLMAQPFVAVLLFPAFQRAWAWSAVKGPRPAWWVCAMAVVQLGLFARAIQPFMDQANTERALAGEVNALHPPRIYTHGMGAAFTNYCAPLPVTELWYSVMDTFEQGAVVVVKPQNLMEQWKGLPPGINWQRMRDQGVELLDQHPDGWSIGRVR
jgi:hypothetical protein